MWALGGHLGSAVSALVDGQLDAESTEQARQHVAGCPTCRAQVQREEWVKAQVSGMDRDDADAPPAGLMGSLYQLPLPTADAGAALADAWARVDALEDRHRARRRAGLVAAGAGSVGAAVLGLSALGGLPSGGTAPAGASLHRPSPTAAGGTARFAARRMDVAPIVAVTGPLTGWRMRRPAH